MPKVCVIGDSHAAALTLGWPSIKSAFPDLAFTWFAANETLYDGLVLADGKLMATTQELIERFEYTSRGLRAIAGDYDLYLLCGLKLAPQQAFVARKEYWSRHGAIPVAAFKTEIPEAIEAELRNSAAARMLAMLRTIASAPIGAIAIPRPHSFDEPRALAPAAIRRLRLLADAFETACRRVAEEHGAIFLPQPAETLADDNAMGSKSVFAARPKEDPDRGHKNAAYGAIVLRDALRTMLPSGTPLGKRPD
jgi:hypothetical protein